MPLINSELNLILTWSESCIISNAAVSHTTTFAITDPKLYVSVVTLWTQDNAKILQQVNQDSNAQLTGISINQKQQNRML